MRIKTATVLLLLGPALASAQSPSTAVETALGVLVGGFGGCGPERQVSSHPVRFFPSVRFTQMTCLLEHGDSARAMVGIDSDSVLYLLASRDAFNFLVVRHPPSGLDSATTLSYAYAALELSGNVLNSSPVNSPADVPAIASAEVRRSIRELPYVGSVSGGRGWDVSFVTRAKGQSTAPSLWRHDFVIGRDGRLWSLQSIVLWSAPGIPMPPRPSRRAPIRHRPNDR